MVRDCPVGGAGEMCWCDRSKDGVDGEGGKKGSGCNFYDEMRITREAWYSRVSARVTEASS